MKRFITMLLTIVLTFSTALSITACAPEIPSNPTFKVVATAVNGTVLTDKTTVNQGEPVSITATANTGYILEKLEINGGVVTPAQSTDIMGNYKYTYVAPSVLRDYTVKATFCKTQVVVKYTGEGVNELDRTVAYGGVIGELPTPLLKAKRFMGWSDADGNIVSRTTRVNTADTLTLTAVWGEVEETEKQGLVPQGASTTYYDEGAKDIGVAWQTFGAPIASVVMVKPASVEGWEDDSVETYSATMQAWEDVYLSRAVVDGLGYSTQYIARFGDYAADVWSDEYTFTTRAEEIEEVQFMYIADTQEDGNLGEKTNYRNPHDTNELLNDTGWSLCETSALAHFGDFDFLAHGGDIVNFGAETRQWREMLGSVGEHLFEVPTQVVAGNHEGPRWYTAQKTTVSNVFNYHKVEGGWYDEDTEEKLGDFYKASLETCGPLYSFDYGPIHFVALRSNDYYEPDPTTGIVDFRLDETQVRWLEHDLKKAREANPNCWLITMIHEAPFYTDSTGRGEIAMDLMPIFEECKVDLLLFGHNHWIASTYPLYWNEEGASQRNDYDFFTETAPCSVTKTTYDGVEVDLIELTSDQWGTVMHETGCGGYQWNSNQKAYTTDTTARYRRRLGGGASINGHLSPLTNKQVNRSMYATVNVTEDTLVVRTYGVDILGLYFDNFSNWAKAQDGYTAPTDEYIVENYEVYLDGFMLKKNITQD